ncbi:MAG: lipopolysaccharide biosynthesis protein [Rhodospirillaceae bacterium]|nr:lipopolysaccharide biosynthesis protein [Rhodospirillaceae bacterium]
MTETPPTPPTPPVPSTAVPSTPEPSTSERGEVIRNLARGSTWMVAMRWGVRLIGLVSTVILARVLVPEDFGVVAMAMLVIAFLEVFADTGQQYALIRHPAPDRPLYDSAWSMSVLINTGITAILLAVAPLSETYFNDPRIAPVIQLLSLRVFFSGLINIGIIEFRRNLDFRREFQFWIARKLSTFVMTLGCVLIWPSYWSLAIGTVTGHAIEVVISYRMHPYRPRFNLSRVREIWSYSIWLLAASLGRFFESRIDEVVVAGVTDATRMGKYTISSELGSLPVTEVLDPVTRALFPNYVKLNNNPQALREAYLTVLNASILVAASLGVGIAMLSQDIVAVLLGDQWADISPLIGNFALAAAVIGVCNSVYPILNAVGESRQTAVQTWLRVVCYLPAMYWAATTAQLENFALARLGVSIVLVPTFFIRLRGVVPVAWLDLIKQCWRGPLAALAMAAALDSIAFGDVITISGVRLLVEVLIGATVFVATVIALWALAGRPDSVEKIALQAACRLLTRARA